MATFYCTACGAPAANIRRSIDLSRPHVYCATAWHKPGWYPGVPTPDEARAAMAGWTRAEALRKHRGHIASGRIKSCPVCADLSADTQPART